MGETPLDVVCIGEALVDFLPEAPGQRVRDVERWIRCTGGAPANVAVGLARLGARSAMLGVVGDDEFGSFLVASLEAEGVDVSHLRRTREGKTGLVFISLTDAGERTFSFYRTRSAEFLLSRADVAPEFLSRARCLHFGTNSLMIREAQRATVHMARTARSEGKLVSCDPNLRLHAWTEPGELKAVLNALLPNCDVVKLSEEELEFVVGTTDPEQALLSLRQMGVALPVVTLGSEGAFLLWQHKVVRVPSPKAEVVDTTGAGDGFMAGLLFGLTRLYPDSEALRRAGVGELRELAAFACRIGSRVVEKLGASTGLPRLKDMHGSIPKLLSARRP